VPSVHPLCKPLHRRLGHLPVDLPLVCRCVRAEIDSEGGGHGTEAQYPILVERYLLKLGISLSLFKQKQRHANEEQSSKCRADHNPSDRTPGPAHCHGGNRSAFFPNQDSDLTTLNRRALEHRCICALKRPAFLNSALIPSSVRLLLSSSALAAFAVTAETVTSSRTFAACLRWDSIFEMETSEYLTSALTPAATEMACK
jgi:hypothetical protein